MPGNVRLGLIGYGRRGRDMFRRAVKEFEAVEPVAICDRSPAALAGAETDWPDVRRFESFDAMLDAAPMNALLVETPASLHAEFCGKALGRDICVMSDVPCVDTVEQARMLWAAQQKSRAFYMMGANPNMWAYIETAVDLNRKGLLGEPYYMEAEYIHDVRSLWKATPWRRTYESIRYCTHSLGPILRLIEEDLEWVSCFDTGSHINHAPDEHDAMAALFRTPSGVVVRFLASFITNYPGGCEHRYRVYGTKGYFERTPPYGGTARTLFWSQEMYGEKKPIDLPVHELRPEYADNPEIGGHGGADYVIMEKFLAAVKAGGPSPIDLRQALRMSLPGIYAAESARRGGELVRILYPWSAA